jgi:hypothetical protein
MILATVFGAQPPSSNPPAKSSPGAESAKKPAEVQSNSAPAEKTSSTKRSAIQRTADKIERALASAMNPDFNETPLTQAVAFIASHYDINIFLDERGLQSAQVDKDTLVTLSLGGISLRTILELMLEPLNLGYFVRDNVLVITNKETVASRYDTRVYPVADLVPLSAKPIEFQTLITQCVDRDVWESNGGDCGLRFDPVSRSIVVRASQPTHRTITSLLKDLRAALANNGKPREDANAAHVAQASQ